MIRALVDFALKSRWLVLGGVAVLTAWGVISFKALPIEAYPDVANNYVQIITQWPGRSEEEIERQVTVPVEIQMAGIPHLTRLVRPHHEHWEDVALSRLASTVRDPYAISQPSGCVIQVTA